MTSFELALDPEAWTEIGFGFVDVAFDLSNAQSQAEVYLNLTGTDPGAVSGNKVASWPASWDFLMTGMTDPRQRIFVKGSGKIVGVRGT